MNRRQCVSRGIVFIAGLGLLAFAITTPLAFGAPENPSKKSDDSAKKVEKIDLNAATPEQLQELPGIGPALAKKIVDGRPYKSIGDLAKAGIPAATIDKITSLVTVKQAPKSVGDEVKPKADKPAAKSDKPSGKIDLNAATVAELEELPGIGPAYAKKIIDGRPYKSVDELSKTGIPAATAEKIAPLFTVKATATEKPSKSVDKRGKDVETREASTPPKKGMVWVNTESKIYHKEGSRWYGKTTNGKWMTEEEAVKDGNHASKNE